jgi:hypothetical protein
VDALSIGADQKKLFYVCTLSSKTLVYKGMLNADQLGPMFADCAIRTSSRRSRSCTSVQHEHVSVLAACASVSLHRAQRRDQHAHRQHQLDARPRGLLQSSVSASDLEQAPSVIREGGQRHGDRSTTCSSSWSMTVDRCRTRSS